MKCPFCGEMEDHVLDSRPTYDGKTIRRRRECLACHRRFTTFEQIETRRLMVVKKDGRREPFDRNKIIQGLVIACRKRHVSTQTLEEMVNEIEREIYNQFETEVSTVEVGRFVMNKLLVVDPVAYVRFASVYQEFQDPKEFGGVVTVLQRMQQKTHSEIEV